MQKGSLLKNSEVVYLLIVGFGSILALGIANLPLFDLDELYFAEITREMMHTGRYGQVTFNFQPLYEKPPLFFWLQAASMHLWGISEIGARFPNLICGLFTLATLYYIGKKYQGNRFGCIWMCLYGTTFLPHFYFKSGIIDPFFNYFLLLAIYFLSTNIKSSKAWIYDGTAGLFLGCALLTKGPMAVVIVVATLSLSYTWFTGSVFPFKRLIVANLVATALFSCWLVPEICANGYTFIKEFWGYHLLLYQQPVYTHDQPWYYHYLILFWGCFPSSLFSIFFLKQKKWLTNNYFVANMQALLASVLLIFTLVGTKIVHYSAMAYFPITFLAAHFFYESIGHRHYICSGIASLFLVVGLVLGSALVIIPLMMQYQTLWIGLLITHQGIKDSLALLVTWNFWDSLPGVIYMIGIGLAYYYLIRDRLLACMRTFMCVNICTLTFFLMRIGPKVAAYTQKEMIDFCKACKGKPLYLTTIGFKSAAPLFYADQPKVLKEKNIDWLLTGEIDKPCFFILYKHDKKLLIPYTDITYVRDMGCLALYQRLPRVLS